LGQQRGDARDASDSALLKVKGPKPPRAPIPDDFNQLVEGRVGESYQPPRNDVGRVLATEHRAPIPA
jgi:hypothetical protein